MISFVNTPQKVGLLQIGPRYSSLLNFTIADVYSMGGRVPHISEGTDELFVGHFETYKGPFVQDSRQLIQVPLYIEVTNESVASSLPGTECWLAALPLHP